ncbi:hypothetical protein IEQ34_003346 [Dendrobium chrysotoxum]|uniref:Uncharacterized protein n=1 Tax=Dendrobium chrysotoxum TaxID=161865 RepID=A0AAV7HJQ2_DENCH|nr:hypothetical protein IEQ34_003346 [Dendrobium chrysotoxum]
MTDSLKFPAWKRVSFESNGKAPAFLRRRRSLVIRKQSRTTPEKIMAPRIEKITRRPVETFFGWTLHFWMLEME